MRSNILVASTDSKRLQKISIDITQDKGNQTRKRNKILKRADKIIGIISKGINHKAPAVIKAEGLTKISMITLDINRSMIILKRKLRKNMKNI